MTDIEKNVKIGDAAKIEETAKNNVKSDADTDSVHQRFVEYGSNAKEWMRKCILLLPEIDKHRIWEKRGFSSIYEYAAKLAGMSRDNVNEGLRILEKISDKPVLMSVVEKKGLWAIKPVANIVTKETEIFWAEKVKELSRHELEAYVRGLKMQGDAGEDVQKDIQNCVRGTTTKSVTTCNLGEELRRTGTVTDYGKLTDVENSCAFDKKSEFRVTVSMDLEPAVIEQLKKLKGDGGWNALMKEFLAIREEKFEQVKPEAKIESSRYIPAKIKKYVLAKYNSKCVFPGCNKRYANFHHTGRFFFENGHDPDTLVPLCEAHHSLAHRGFIENENLSPRKWKVRIKADPNFADVMMLAYKR